MKKQLIVLFLLFAVIGCKKDAQIKSVNATIIYTGELALDGCGWLIKIDNTAADPAIANNYYSPINLKENFKKDKSNVVLSYDLLNTKYNCGMVVGSGYTQIKIITIKNR